MCYPRVLPLRERYRRLSIAFMYVQHHCYHHSSIVHVCLSQLIGTKQEGMINPLYSQSALMKQEQVAQYHYNMNHMIPPPLVESPTLSPSSTLNALSPPSKEEQLGEPPFQSVNYFVNMGSKAGSGKTVVR